MTGSNNLVPLEDYNKQRISRVFSNQPSLNGIACPLCGNELMDSSPGTALLSYPPKYHVCCPICNFHGYRN